MKRLTKIIIVACFGASAVSAFADDAAKLGAAMQAQMNKYTAAVMKKDYKAADQVILNNFSPKCAFIGQDGKTTDLKTWMKANNAEMMQMKVTSMSLKLTNPKLVGANCTGTENFKMTGSMPSPKNPKKTSKVTVTGTAAMVSTKVNGKWQVVKRTEKSVTMTVDGKPFKPAQP